MAGSTVSFHHPGSDADPKSPTAGLPNSRRHDRYSATNLRQADRRTAGQARACAKANEMQNVSSENAHQLRKLNRQLGYLRRISAECGRRRILVEDADSK